jgi:hypothetical protein
MVLWRQVVVGEVVEGEAPYRPAHGCRLEFLTGTIGAHWVDQGSKRIGIMRAVGKNPRTRSWHGSCQVGRACITGLQYI